MHSLKDDELVQLEHDRFFKSVVSGKMKAESTIGNLCKNVENP